ncbi:arylsulfotransferase [Exophiala viscosa]|uniref:Arylsulfotransferase n=1 Tax=Exophiala viscosa TaxID=2486360 RepID=A0AAN6E648_9EURO|nr:arylsulfotransferase [Exophiala viscosa]
MRLFDSMKPQLVRALVVVGLAATGAVLLFYTVAYLLTPLFAWLSPTLNPTLYDLGFYGACPLQKYVSSDVTGLRTTAIKWDESCDNGYVLLTPSGDSVGAPGPTIIDSQGEVVWKAEGYQVTTNLKVQKYKGQDYLTFWSGKKWGSLGAGSYFMLDSSYRVAYEVKAVGENMFGDLHEFKITNDDTALLTVYHTVDADLSPLGKASSGWLTENTFQEIDIATGELLFEWRASEHVDLTEGYMWNPFGGYLRNSPFDYYHLNSMDKDSHGNYLISARHTHTITSLSPTGEIQWILGGRHNQFTDLSGGAALDFRWQHDARWWSEEEGILTLFDNQEGGVLNREGPYSKGMMLKLDVANRTVELLHEYISLQKTRAPSQGSVQYLPESNHMFVGWGHSPAFSEYSLNGTLLCEHHFGASWLHVWNRAVSYRSFKSTTWVGRPREPPSVKIEDQTLYVSWNGATEVVAWELQGAVTEADDYEFTALDVIDKEAFEESFELTDLWEYTRFRVAALDRTGQVLSHSEVVSYHYEGGWWRTIFAVLAWAVVFTICWHVYKRIWRWKHTGANGFKWKSYELRTRQIPK